MNWFDTPAMPLTSSWNEYARIVRNCRHRMRGMASRRSGISTNSSTMLASRSASGTYPARIGSYHDAQMPSPASPGSPE